MDEGLFIDIFKDKRLRLSHPRLWIYQEFADTKTPLSSQELYQSLLKKHRKDWIDLYLSGS